MIRLEIRPEAAADLETAAAWYERQRSGLGEEFLDASRSQFQRIIENPLQFRRFYREVRRALLRRFPFAIYFRHVDNVVIVFAILHLRRSESSWHGRT